MYAYVLCVIIVIPVVGYNTYTTNKAKSKMCVI